tara:strand:+ start:4086 stop:4622 length:537 start_codon:yes stop_codon:yes gene_type:complete
MKVIKTKIKDCVIVQPDVYEDERGFFLETFHHERYMHELNITKPFIQDNHSNSKKGILRGLHFQKNKPQGKLVRAVTGEVFDVAVDLRQDSITYGKWEGVFLSGKNKKQMWVPPGFAHGFLVISDYVDFEYKCTDYYDPDDEGSLRWNDPTINIDWPLQDPTLSEKDFNAPFLNDLYI